MADSEFDFFYRELRALAARLLKDERAGHTLQPTALVHEAFVRLSGHGQTEQLGRVRFLALAATVMRNVLVDYARANRSAKRGSGAERVTLDESHLVSDPEVDVLSLDEALHRLARFDSRQAQMVEMRFFAGMSVPEVAEALSISEKTVVRDWAMARAWLSRELGRVPNGTEVV